MNLMSYTQIQFLEAQNNTTECAGKYVVWI
jgi:hypothetical protein